MLEEVFEECIQKIKEVLNSHDELSDKKTMHSRNWEFIFSDFDDWVVLYSSTHKLGGYWIYPKLHPKNKIDSLEEQLPDYDFSPDSAAYGEVMNGKENWIEPFWEEFGSFKNSEIPIFFHRQYYGYPKGEENYYEMNQLVTHLLDLHYSSTKNAYCRMNSQGEEIEEVKIIKHDVANLILIRRQILDKLLYLGGWILVRYFNYSRYKTNHPSLTSFNSYSSENFVSEEYKMKYKVTTCKNEFVQFRGAQLEYPRATKQKKDKKYAEFTIYDWKNKRILENYSVAPHNFANYYTESDLPFETSPIFFQAEVLDEYKNNPDKYKLKERSIDCRGGWYLETYDINEYNQVHTYAVYLARLPYKEQLRWQRYNEKPKGKISKRAVQTDFLGKFSEESKFEKLKKALKKLETFKIGKDGHTIWSPKGGNWETATKQLYYVNTENPNQWHDFIIALTNTTNEGFQKKPLKKIAGKFELKNKTPKEKKEGSLGLIKFILKESGNESQIPVVHEVLNDLQIKRGKGKAHGSWIAPGGSLIQDAEQTLSNVIEAINKLAQVIEKILKNSKLENIN